MPITIIATEAILLKLNRVIEASSINEAIISIIPNHCIDVKLFIFKRRNPGL
jgi:hypothetical protein